LCDISEYIIKSDELWDWVDRLLCLPAKSGQADDRMLFALLEINLVEIIGCGCGERAHHY